MFLDENEQIPKHNRFCNRGEMKAKRIQFKQDHVLFRFRIKWVTCVPNSSPRFVNRYSYPYAALQLSHTTWYGLWLIQFPMSSEIPFKQTSCKRGEKSDQTASIRGPLQRSQKSHPAGDLVEAWVVEGGVQINTLNFFDPVRQWADSQAHKKQQPQIKFLWKIRDQPQIHLLPECRCSILEASPTANRKSPVYKTFPWRPSNRNLGIQSTG